MSSIAHTPTEIEISSRAGNPGFDPTDISNTKSVSDQTALVEENLLIEADGSDTIGVTEVETFLNGNRKTPSLNSRCVTKA